MIDLEPEYITSDMHGTLIRWHLVNLTRKLLADAVPAAPLDEVLAEAQELTGVAS